MNEHVNPVDVKCPVDWNRVPEWANWVAVEPNGAVYCYAAKPTWSTNQWLPDFEEYYGDIECTYKILITDYSATYIPTDPTLLWQRPKPMECPVNWSWVPDWVNWVATQPDGDVIGYSSKPVWNAELHMWMYERHILISGYLSNDIPSDASICIWERGK